MSENDENSLSPQARSWRRCRKRFPELGELQILHRADLRWVQASKRDRPRAPSLRVSVLGVAGTAPVGSGEVDAELSLAIYILTVDSGIGEGRRERDEAALALLSGVLFVVAGNRWGVEGADEAKKVRAENLFSSEIDRKRIAFWAVTWTQKLRIGNDIFSEDGAMPSEIYASHAPEIGIPYKDKYRKIPDAT